MRVWPRKITLHELRTVGRCVTDGSITFLSYYDFFYLSVFSRFRRLYWKLINFAYRALLTLSVTMHCYFSGHAPDSREENSVLFSKIHLREQPIRIARRRIVPLKCDHIYINYVHDIYVHTFSREIAPFSRRRRRQIFRVLCYFRLRPCRVFCFKIDFFFNIYRHVLYVYIYINIHVRIYL